MRKSTKRLLFAVGTSAAAMYAYNCFIENTAAKNNLLSTEDGCFYSWKNGTIFYTKKGSGSPLLLIHDTNACASSAEWTKIMHRLEKKHTVYYLDLLGCGRSEKPALEYTNYLYVQLITAFVKEVIQEKTAVAASNMSASFVIMANHMDSSLFCKMIFINPISLKKLTVIPDKSSKRKKQLIELPLIGTFIYNRMNSSQQIDKKFRTDYYAKAQLVSAHLEDIYYESAHIGKSNGKYLYASHIGNYLNNSIVHAVKNINIPTYIIGSKGIKNNELTLDDYHRLNNNIRISRIAHGNLYPHMELPEKITGILEEILN